MHHLLADLLWRGLKSINKRTRGLWKHRRWIRLSNAFSVSVTGSRGSGDTHEKNRIHFAKFGLKAQILYSKHQGHFVWGRPLLKTGVWASLSELFLSLWFSLSLLFSHIWVPPHLFAFSSESMTTWRIFIDVSSLFVFSQSVSNIYIVVIAATTDL